MAREHDKRTDTALRKIDDLLGVRERDSYEALRNRLTKARDLFHDVLAERFTGAFNAHLAAQPQQTLAEKQEMTRNANADLRSLGLALKCPRTGEPAVLHAGVGHNADRGCFQIQLRHSGGAGHKRTVTSQDLFQVTLMTDGPDRSPLADYWTDRAAARGKKRTR